MSDSWGAPQLTRLTEEGAKRNVFELRNRAEVAFDFRTVQCFKMSRCCRWKILLMNRVKNVQTNWHDKLWMYQPFSTAMEESTECIIEIYCSQTVHLCLCLPPFKERAERKSLCSLSSTFNCFPSWMAGQLIWQGLPMSETHCRLKAWSSVECVEVWSTSCVQN